MKVLTISLDRALLGERVSTGDAITRHREYARYVARLDIIVFSRSGYSTRQIAENIFCYPTNSKSKIGYFFNALAIARRLYAENIYDLVVCQDPFLTGLVGWFITLRFKAKLLIHFHGDFWDNPFWLKERWLNRPLLWLSHFTARRSDALRVVSPGIKLKLVKKGILPSKIRIIGTPVDLSKFSAPDNNLVNHLRAEFAGQKIIFWSGRMSPEKNLSWLLRAFESIRKSFPPVVLVLAGHGNLFDKIRREALALNLEHTVKFLGHVDYDELASYYHAADLFVLPSLHESYGKVLLEAAAAGKAAVASATTGARTILQDGKTGLLAPINNEKKFIAAVLKLLKDDSLRLKMGSAAYNHVVQNFSFEENVKKVVSYWEEIIMGLRINKRQIN